MAKNLTPSTQWQERVAPDEAQRFAAYGQQFVAIQARKSKKYGNGRALHRKQITAAKGTLEVLADLPDFARHGLFAKPGSFETRVRLSNGGLDRAPDRMPDIRGFALHVVGVKGDSALGNGPAVGQDFALINQEVSRSVQRVEPAYERRSSAFSPRCSTRDSRRRPRSIDRAFTRSAHP